MCCAIGKFLNFTMTKNIEVSKIISLNLKYLKMIRGNYSLNTNVWHTSKNWPIRIFLCKSVNTGVLSIKSWSI